MGLFAGRYSSSRYTTDRKNPDPKRFVIKSSQRIGSYYVALIQYPNCTNYEGNKLLLMCADPHNQKEIDPHFMEGGIILARFEPTKWGAKAAKELAKLMSERN